MDAQLYFCTKNNYRKVKYKQGKIVNLRKIRYMPEVMSGASDYAIWEERYSRPGRKRHLPDSLLLEHWKDLVGPRVLDVACGEGRNSIFLAEKGFEVIGVDRSPTAIKKAQMWAQETGVCAEFICEDLERLVLPKVPYDSIVVTRYWQPNLCALLIEALRPGGIILYETYTTRYLNYRSESTRSHLLKSGELRKAFERLDILHYAEVDKPSTREYCAQLVGRRPL